MENWTQQRRGAKDQHGDKTQTAGPEDEIKMLRLRNAELSAEVDMLRKSSAYFAGLNK